MSPPPTSAPPRPISSPASGLERLLPQDLEAERAVLGSMLLEKEAIGEVISVLRDAGARAFKLESHQQLYSVLIDLYVDDRPLDGVVIKDELVRRGSWDKLGKFDFLGGLVSAVPSALRAAHYAHIVYEKYLLRQLVAATHRVMEKALDNDEPAREVLDYAEKEIFDVTERRVTGEARELSELVREAFKTIENRGKDALTGEPTGFLELDSLTCGLQPGELIIVAGRPSMGKTALGLNMAEHLAIVESPRRPVLFCSLEMSRQQVAQRILCSRARVDSHRLRRGRHSNQDMALLQRVAADLNTAPLLVDDTPGLTVLELRARARMAMRRYALRAIFVDYLQLMGGPRAESRQVEVASISRGLKALAKDLNVPVVAMAQLNRSPEDKSRRGNRPRMSDLRESGAIEQDADVIALLHRESYYKSRQLGGPAGEAESSGSDEDADENLAELIVAKQRNGPVGTIRLHWNKSYTRFDNPSFGGEPGYIPPDFSQAPF